MMVMMVSWFKKPQNLKTNITLKDINAYMIGGKEVRPEESPRMLQISLALESGDRSINDELKI